MRKIQILGAFIAVLAFSALAVGSASATLWLKSGASLTKAEATTSHGVIIFHHTGGIFGNALVECTGLFVGTVGPGAEDLITLAENLTGSEKDLVKCVSLSGFCGSPVLHPENLPWHTLLLLREGKTFDMVEAESGGGEPAYEMLCSIGKVLCRSAVESDFLGNDADGALFTWLPSLTPTPCNDGGTGTLLGEALTLGFTVS